MIIRKQPELRYSDVTPKSVYLNRRRFLGDRVSRCAGSPGWPVLGLRRSDEAQRSQDASAFQRHRQRDSALYRHQLQ